MTDWIDCKDGYPEEGVQVLVWNRALQKFEVDYIIDLDPDKIWACTHDDRQHDISHWMLGPDKP